MHSRYIDLHREFHELSPGKAGAGADTAELLPTGKRLDWTGVLALSRVVVLSEAGAGKTEEIRRACRRLRHQGKAAFFLRLEHLAAGSSVFELAFESGLGDAMSFRAWCDGTDEGWVFLDSVDESRLRSPRDFEAAIRVISRALGPAKQRAHIVITGRPHAWRPSTDLALCVQELPFIGGEIAVPAADDDEDVEHGRYGPESPTFLILALDDLTDMQVERFARERGVADTQAFMEALVRSDARQHAARPLDLEELVAYWLQHGSIGSRLALIEHNVRSRLLERDPNRSELESLTVSGAHEGARLVAAACMLTGQAAIQVPGAPADTPGLVLEDLLPDWTPQQRAQLLGRPIFDESLYGTVRIATLTYREFLAAEFFRVLLERPASRRLIEQLFFRTQYGVAVVVPTLRTLLPWLAIWDPRIQSRLKRVAPEVLLAGGDPQRLSRDLRQEILEEYCRRVAALELQPWSIDSTDVERFAAPDIEDQIGNLLRQYAVNDRVTAFLLRMVWRGQLRGLLEECLQIAACSTADPDVRTLAIRAAGTIDQGRTFETLMRCLGSESVVSRMVLSEVVDVMPAEETAFDRLAACFAKVPEPERYSEDHLRFSLVGFVDKAPLNLLPPMADHFSNLLVEPFHEEDATEETLPGYSWVLEPAVRCLERLISARHPVALSLTTLRILDALAGAADYVDRFRHKLEQLVPEWRELNYAYFWHLVERERASALTKGEEPQMQWWSYRIHTSPVRFKPEDFDFLLEQTTVRQEIADHRIGLDLAFRLYVDGGRDPASRKKLWAFVAGNPVLHTELSRLLHPPPASDSQREFRKLNDDYKRRAAKRAQRDRHALEKSKEYLVQHVADLRSGKSMTQAHVYLHSRLRSSMQANQWSKNDWHLLCPQYGEAVARAFRDAAVEFWRLYRPQVQSEGAPANSTPIQVSFGLFGLAIEAAETPNWLETLSEADAELATQYAVLELNGFPSWLPGIHARYPEVASSLLLREIEFELATEGNESGSTYVLYDVSWCGDWAWSKTAPVLLEKLRSKEPAHIRNLNYLLSIVQGADSVTGEVLAALAQQKCTLLTDPERLGTWAAVWTGVQPEDAVAWVESKLAELDATNATTAAMHYMVQLMGGRMSTSRTRAAFKSPAVLQRLYLVAHRYVREAEDIDRAGKGVYSPGLRDHAQEAREAIFNLLNEIPGNEAYAAICKIANDHPDASSAPYLRMHAKRKAERESDSPRWSAAQVLAFARHQQLIPVTARDLFDLTCLRLEDLRDNLEEGDDSIAAILREVNAETKLRNYIGGWLRDRAAGLYTVAQEDELADAKRPDLRIGAGGLDAPVPVELKIVDNGWSGPLLFERLEVQLCGSYTRDFRSRFGVFALVWRGEKQAWDLPDASRVDFQGLLAGLRQRWRQLAAISPGIDEVAVIGIDLTKRDRRV